MFTMPYGYGTAVVTEAELQAKQTFNRLHPEMQRRFLALAKHLHSRGWPLGVGTGWRIQPEGKPGFAAPGNSWHEGVPVESQANALAIDTVPASSWNAMETELARFGLRSFRHVNNEPWHIQPIEIPTSRRYATTLPPLKVWDLPGDTTPPEEDDDMTTLPKPKRIYDSRTADGPFGVGESRSIVVGMTTEAFVNVTVVSVTAGPGFVSLNDPEGGTSVVNYSPEDKVEANAVPVLTPNGRIVVTNFRGIAHVVVDVFAQRP